MFSKRHLQPLGLGILFNQRGLALAQSPMASDDKQTRPAWHWQTFSSHFFAPQISEWPEPHCLRWARQRSGFMAQTVGMALPRDKLFRLTCGISPGMGTRQLQAHLQAQLEPVLPWPINETLWDYQLNVSHDTAMLASPLANRPAWLNAALQAQPALQAEVLAMPKAWAQACEHWCRQAGLRLVRLEPEWQASMRWQQFVQNSKSAALKEMPSEVTDKLSDNEWAVLGGLALGVVRP
ncbi:MAG: hypothetical protein ACKO5X_06775 [Limnohabitans sp.]